MPDQDPEQHMPDISHLKIRGRIEEKYANLFVENSVEGQENDLIIVWIRFIPAESEVKDVWQQVRQIAKEFKLELVMFAVGHSKYLVYSTKLDDFFRVRTMGNLVPSLNEMERLKIPRHHVYRKIKSLFLEDKWRGIINAGNSAPSKTNKN